MTTGGPDVFLHIGTMKTGTTYLQQLLMQNRDALAGEGYLLPGAQWVDQVRAAEQAVTPRRRPTAEGRSVVAWQAARREMLDHPGKAVVFSVEFLSFASGRRARRIIEDLDPTRVHVVLTVRDTCAVLPALWQTHCSNGGTATWSAFARSSRFGALGPAPVAPLIGQGARLFRHALDIPAMLERWSVPPERLHVVTVPASGSSPTVLWERFAAAIGLEPTVATRQPSARNPSLGYASADLMRRLNRELGRLPREQYDPTVKYGLAGKILVRRAEVEARAGLDRRTEAFAIGWNERVRTAVTQAGAHLVGDLDDLPDRPAGDDLPRSIEPPRQPELLAAAAHALAGMRRVVRRRAMRLRALGGAPAGHDAPEPVALARTRWEAAEDPVREAVHDLAHVTRVAMDHQQRLRTAGADGYKPNARSMSA